MKSLDEITHRFVGLVALFALFITSVSADAAVKFATGLSGETNAATAAAEAAAQMKAKLGGTVPDLIVICDNKQVADINPVLNAIAVEFPGVDRHRRRLMPHHEKGLAFTPVFSPSRAASTLSCQKFVRHSPGGLSICGISASRLLHNSLIIRVVGRERFEPS